jgi:hypothetical protein
MQVAKQKRGVNMTRRALFVALLLGAAACGGSDTSNDSLAVKDQLGDGGTWVCQPGQTDPRACDPTDTKKTTICHIPPGNPANAHTLCVGNPAVPAHMAHGDYLGQCKCDVTTPPTTPPPTPPTTPPPPPTPPTTPPPPPVTPPGSPDLGTPAPTPPVT